MRGRESPFSVSDRWGQDRSNRTGHPVHWRLASLAPDVLGPSDRITRRVAPARADFHFARCVRTKGTFLIVQRPKTRLGLPIFTLATDRAPEFCVVVVVMHSLRF